MNSGLTLTDQKAAAGGPTAEQIAAAPAAISTPAPAADARKPAGITSDKVAPPVATAAAKPTGNVVDQLTAVATPGSNAYLIGPQDVLDITVFKVPELTKSVQVADTGTINLPLLDEVPAAGKSAYQLEKELVAKLGAKYLQKPQVTVLVKEYNSQRLTLDGAVKKPGVYPLRGGLTLLEAISRAEGLDPNADSTVVVFRSVDGKRTAAKFDIAEIRSGTLQDPALKAGDLVVAPTSLMKESLNNVLKVLPLAGAFAMIL